MKIRSDYVSNSSSSSFIVNGGEAAKMFYEDFKEFLNGYEPMGETMRVQIKKNSPDEYDWDMPSIEEFAADVESGKESWDDVKYLYFNCDDWDSNGLMYLNFLYRYFERFGFKPDDSDTEHSFRNNSDDSFLAKLLSKINASETTQRKGKTNDENKN